MAGTSWPALTAGRKAKASEVESKLDWIEGSLIPMNSGSSTDNAYDLGTSSAYWRAGWVRSLNPTTTANGVAIGTTTVANNSDVAFEIAGTRAVLLPRLSAAQRTALTGINGMVVYDSTDNLFYTYENGAWQTMGQKIGLVAKVEAHVASAATTSAVSFTGSGRLIMAGSKANTGGGGATSTVQVILDSVSSANMINTQTTFRYIARDMGDTTTVFADTSAASEIDYFFKSQFKYNVSSGGGDTVTSRIIYERS